MRILFLVAAIVLLIAPLAKADDQTASSDESEPTTAPADSQASNPEPAGDTGTDSQSDSTQPNGAQGGPSRGDPISQVLCLVSPNLCFAPVKISTPSSGWGDNPTPYVEGGANPTVSWSIPWVGATHDPYQQTGVEFQHWEICIGHC